MSMEIDPYSLFDSTIFKYDRCDFCHFESIHRSAAPSKWTYVILYAVTGMSEESLSYPRA